MKCSNQEAMVILCQLVNQPLHYGIKSPDCDLYDIGFGEMVDYVGLNNEIRKVCNYTLHITCRFKIIKKKEKQTTCCYFEDTPSSIFQYDVSKLIGLCVKRIALSDKNDLWIDLGDYWIVIATFENNEESWCFFTFDSANLFLSVSNSYIEKIVDGLRGEQKAGDGLREP